MSHLIHRLSSVALSALMLGALAAPAALAQTSPTSSPAMAGSQKACMGKHKHHGEHKKFVQELGLSAEQQKQMKANHEAFRQENQAAIASMKAKHEQLKQLGTDPANEAQRQQLRQELRQERKALWQKKEASMQSILTPEQKAKWEAKKQERRANYAKKHANSQPTQ